MDTNFLTTYLLIWVITGAIGAGYFIYWKKQSMAMPMICGIALCVYPYFFWDIWVLIGIGIVLIALPFFLRF
jgi:hypothetical protein